MKCNFYKKTALSLFITEMSTFNGRRFGQHPPPISKLIKAILEKYPNGQIFKVYNLTV